MAEMTAEKVFNIVVRYGFCGDCRWSFGDKHCITYDCYQRVKFIKEALEKQIPKKPKKEDKENLFCPTCGCFLGFESVCMERKFNKPHCSCCGQAIDWSDCFHD